jgi:hypothetical protein
MYNRKCQFSKDITWMVLCIFSLFNDAGSKSDHRESNEPVISEKLSG